MDPLCHVSFLSREVGWVATCNGSQSTIYHTTDGGTSWVPYWQEEAGEHRVVTLEAAAMGRELWTVFDARHAPTVWELQAWEADKAAGEGAGDWVRIHRHPDDGKNPHQQKGGGDYQRLKPGKPLSLRAKALLGDNRMFDRWRLYILQTDMATSFNTSQMVALKTFNIYSYGDSVTQCAWEWRKLEVAQGAYRECARWPFGERKLPSLFSDNPSCANKVECGADPPARYLHAAVALEYGFRHGSNITSQSLISFGGTSKTLTPLTDNYDVTGSKPTGGKEPALYALSALARGEDETGTPLWDPADVEQRPSMQSAAVCVDAKGEAPSQGAALCTQASHVVCPAENSARSPVLALGSWMALLLAVSAPV